MVWLVANLLISLVDGIRDITDGASARPIWMEKIISNCLRIAQADPVKYPDPNSILSKLRLNDMWFREVFIRSGIISSILGAYFGIVLDVIFFSGTPWNINITRSRKKMLLRFLVIVVIFWVPQYTLKKVTR